MSSYSCSVHVTRGHCRCPNLTEAADGAVPDLDLVQVPLVDVVALQPVDDLHVLQLV